jgi:hypothetical protein
MTSDDEIRRILNDVDIDRLRRRFLCCLKDMDNDANKNFEFHQIYEEMELGGYNLPLAIRIVIKDFLLPQNLRYYKAFRSKNLDICFIYSDHYSN